MAWSRRETRISFHPLLLLLEIISKPLCSFRTWTVLILPPHHRIKGLLNGKVLPRCGRKNVLSDSITSSLSPLLVFVCALLVCFVLLFWVNLVLCIDLFLFNMFLFVYFSVLCYFVFHIKIKIKLKNQKNTKTVCVCVH